jgi:transcription elongation factor Elf1
MRMRNRPRVHWVVFDSKEQAIICLRCGERHAVRLPEEVRRFARRCDLFSKLHDDCKEKPDALQGQDPRPG